MVGQTQFGCLTVASPSVDLADWSRARIAASVLSALGIFAVRARTPGRESQS